MNRPGSLERIYPHDEHSAHLIFRDQWGRRCGVYARKLIPASPGPHPVVIHAPGGGQTVSDGDLEWWCHQGFACVSFDWQHGLYDHDPRQKSSWPDSVLQQGQPAQRIDQLIIPLAVQAVGVVIDWMAQDPRCDPERIGLTGISWGGYLTWVANAHEPRLKAAVPVYGCGGLFESEHSCQIPIRDEVRAHWGADFEPLHLGQRQLSPVCFLSGTNDFFGWPQHADHVLRTMTVPYRRCYLPNGDHAVDVGASRLAVAWMRQWLCGGPAVPDEPQATDAGESWHSFSTGSEDRMCWWPGVAPLGATAHLVRQTSADGICVSSAIKRITASEASPLAGVWPDARAGIGWHWSLSTTQLHGNEAVSVTTHEGDQQRVRVTGNRADGSGITLRHTADPRWNTYDFSGMRVRFDCPGRNLTVTWHMEALARRWTQSTPAIIDADGWLRLDQPPESWKSITRIDLDGLPGPSFILGPIERF